MTNQQKMFCPTVGIIPAGIPTLIAILTAITTIPELLPSLETLKK